MSRPVDSWALALAALHRVAADDPPSWLTAGADAAQLVARVRADVLALIEADGPSATARALGVSRTTLAVWRERGGWLHVRARARS